ncbi:TMEM175 family protein, partial [Escherichia coli]
MTIMVLEMKAPEEHGLAHLWALWPVFTAYVLSYAYVAIYWVNHH